MPAPAFERQNVKPIPAPAEPCVIRRFEMPDMSQHGAWVSERLMASYPHLKQGMLYGWLNSILYSREFLFLYQPHAVALAQTFSGHTLAPRPVIREWFVFAQDRENAAHIEEAARFYPDFARWAKAQDAEAITFSELSDVPPDKIKASLGLRVFEKTQLYAKL